MKVTCNICGGTLVVDVGGSIASCTSCGMGYTLERVREMAGISKQKQPVKEHVREKEQPKEPARPAKRSKTRTALEQQSEPALEQQPAPAWEEVKIEPTKIRIRTAVKSGFQCMTLHCVVESGTFEISNDLYVDGDESKICRVGKMRHKDMEIDTALKEMQVVLTVYGSQVKHLKNAKCLTAPAAISGSLEEEIYFTQLLTTHFKGYTLKRNIRITTKNPSVPASYVLFKNQKPVLAIILCSSKIYNMPKIENTMEACKKQGIPVQRYFTEFENDKEYVINRIKSAL